MEKNFLKTVKTARYYTLGNPGNEIRYVWFVLHGYGQLAEYFLEKCRVLQNAHTLVVAPEALHRYYTNGSAGKVGASWMTKEERQTDINDYVMYLDSLHTEIQKSCPNAKTAILGFSQGAATAARWVAYGKVKPVKVIFWGGLFPPDLDWELAGNKWSNVEVKALIGSEDEFYKSAEFATYYKPVFEKLNKASLIEYEGKHTIYEKVLKELMINE